MQTDDVEDTEELSASDRWLSPQPAPSRFSGAVVYPYLLAWLDCSVAQLGKRSAAVVRDLVATRAQQGLDAYGVPLTAHNGRSAHKDLMQELVDALFYAGQIQIESPSAPNVDRCRRLASEIAWLAGSV